MASVTTGSLAEANEGAQAIPEETSTIISATSELLSRGVVRVDVGAMVDLSGWASELSKVSPMSVFAEDGEYAQYRNILDDPAFPFEAIYKHIGGALTAHFVDSADELRLDDAFAIHYNTSHWNTKVRKHTDPSDITVNLCLERSTDLEGSHVLFFGRKELRNVGEAPLGQVSQNELFRVGAESGWASIHWGQHPHLVTSLVNGHRTNVVLTYCYVDKARSLAMKSDCFNDEALLRA